MGTDTAALSPVNWVQYLQDEGTPHMTLSTNLLSESPPEPGTCDCNDPYTSSSPTADTVMTFGNQGSAEGSLARPEGVVAMVLAGIQVVHELRSANPSEEEVELRSSVNAYTVPASAVVDSTWGGQVRDETISVPAGATNTELTRCELVQTSDGVLWE